MNRTILTLTTLVVALAIASEVAAEQSRGPNCSILLEAAAPEAASVDLDAAVEEALHGGGVDHACLVVLARRLVSGAHADQDRALALARRVRDALPGNDGSRLPIAVVRLTQEVLRAVTRERRGEPARCDLSEEIVPSLERVVITTDTLDEDVPRLVYELVLQAALSCRDEDSELLSLAETIARHFGYDDVDAVVAAEELLRAGVRGEGLTPGALYTTIQPTLGGDTRPELTRVRSSYLFRTMRRAQTPACAPGAFDQRCVVVAASWLMALSRISSTNHSWADGLSAGAAGEVLLDVAEAGGFDTGSEVLATAALQIPLWSMNARLTEREQRRMTYLYHRLGDSSGRAALALRGRVGVVLARAERDPCDGAARLAHVLLEHSRSGGSLESLGDGVTALADDSLNRCDEPRADALRSVIATMTRRGAPAARVINFE